MIESNEKMTELDYEGTRNLGSGCVSQPWIGTYNPDLTPAENPYYYESNRLLFELYLERSQRNTTVPQSHF
uniref:Gastrula zinc finger protein n=1 Tax=Triatoma infestans TaxID=30076 RepID=A0A161M3F0_TRIIF